MALAPGARLGAYEVLSPIGAGGMGEVYRARDTNLHREVALKILPASFTTDPERVARFRREAQVLASLNHPHIAHIHGFDEINGCHFLVMELVDGESLDKRIARGRIPLDDALPIAHQIADALESAHEKGIIHRDLKPANIALTKDGSVKVLDFGLAKAVEATSPSSLDVMNSPTITSPAMMTGVGMILGTAAYMSPEQAKGRPADKRSDLWAFGCVLYEMLTGMRAFGGEDVGDTLASILMKTPDWTALPPQTPAPIRTLLRHCQQKDPKRRLDSAAAARLAIDDAVRAPDEHGLAASEPRHRVAWRIGLPWAISVTLAIALATAWLGSRRGPPEGGTTTRVELTLPDGVELNTPFAPSVALSPDGTRVAFTGFGARPLQLYVRRLKEPGAVPVPGTENILWCCAFSPGSDAVAFVEVGGTLATARLADSLIVPVAGGVDSSGVAWTGDGRLIFSRQRSLWQVPAAGGSATPLLALDREKGEVAHAWPTVINGTEAILFASITGSRGDHQVEVLSLATGKRQVVVEGNFPLYTSSGHLVFFRDGGLFAVPFDAKRLVVMGTPVRVVDDVGVAYLGGPLTAVSHAGSLVYVSSGIVKNRLVWVTRQGVERPMTGNERGYFLPRLAPDGHRIAVAAGGRLWIYDTERATFTRLTSSDPDAPFASLLPVWTPDGKRVVFRHTVRGLQVVDSDGADRADVLSRTSANDLPTSISPDGNTLAFVRLSAETSADIYTLSLHGEPKPHPVVNTPAYEGGPEFSPDGRWLAYVSDDSGQMQVYVRPVSGSDRRWPVSTRGGTAPMWNRSGRELFYLEGQKMMVVRVSATSDLVFSSPEVLFEHPYSWGVTKTLANYDVSPDGQRFLMVKNAASSQHLNLVLNWGEELKRLVPTK